MRNKLSYIVFSTLILFFFVISNYSRSNHPPIKISKQQSALNLNNDFLKILSVGNKRLLSSSLWIITLLESDLEHYKKKDLNSWLYLRFNTISNLEPMFLMNYQFGGQYLSIIKDDIQGAKNILTKGLSFYPDDYNLLFSSAFLHTFELQDYKAGYTLYKKIEHDPRAPRNIKSLLHKLEFYNSDQNLELAYESILATYEQTKDDALKAKLHADLYAIKATIDLECLNNKNQGKKCERFDFDNQAYLLKDNSYIAQRSFKPYVLKTRKDE